MYPIESVLLTSAIFTVTVVTTLAYFAAIFGHGVCRRSVVVAPDYAPHTNYRAVVRNILKHHAVCPDLDVVADCYVSQYLCACAYHNVVKQCGMAFVVFLARAAEGGILINRAVVTYYGSFADYYSVTVVDKQIFAYFCPGVNFYPGKKSA